MGGYSSYTSTTYEASKFKQTYVNDTLFDPMDPMTFNGTMASDTVCILPETCVTSFDFMQASIWNNAPVDGVLGIGCEGSGSP